MQETSFCVHFFQTMGWNLTAKVTVILFKFKWRKKLDWQDSGELTNRFCWRYPQLVKLDMKQSYRLLGVRVKYTKRCGVFTYISHFVLSIWSILVLIWSILCFKYIHICMYQFKFNNGSHTLMITRQMTIKASNDKSILSFKYEEIFKELELFQNWNLPEL